MSGTQILRHTSTPRGKKTDTTSAQVEIDSGLNRAVISKNKTSRNNTGECFQLLIKQQLPERRVCA